MSKKASRKLRNQTPKGQPTPSRHQQHVDKSAIKIAHGDTAYAFVNYFKWNKITYDFGPKLTLLPKAEPKPQDKKSAPAKSRMEKFTALEKQLLVDVPGTGSRLTLPKSDGKYGYYQKLVKRGLFRAVGQEKRTTTFAITPAGEKSRLGLALAKSIESKKALASEKHVNRHERPGETVKARAVEMFNAGQRAATG